MTNMTNNVIAEAASAVCETQPAELKETRTKQIAHPKQADSWEVEACPGSDDHAQIQLYRGGRCFAEIHVDVPDFIFGLLSENEVCPDRVVEKLQMLTAAAEIALSKLKEAGEEKKAEAEVEQ
jgi:hypothetical protein